MIILQRLRVENFKLLQKVEMAFPRQGAVLIEGLNESGKSTLFESVFFALYGYPLVAEGRGRGNLESILRYGEDSAFVELLLDVDETELQVRRSVKRGKPTQASLVVRHPGAPEERIAGVQAVYARMVEELGGLDAEALLNSCFVEQKKLSKLEDLGAGQRRDSLRKLLNLERLTDLADRFRVTPQEERALSEARDRLELARVAARLPEVAAERGEMESRLGVVSLPRQQEPAEEAGGPRESGPGGASWAESAARLEGLRGAAAEARRRGLLLAAISLLGLLGMVVLVARGSQAALVLPLLLALGAVLAVRAFQSSGSARREARKLESLLALQRDALVARMGELEGRRKQAEERLRVDSAGLDLEECRREVDRLARQLEVKRRAAAIVEETMERIVRLVLPNTERNLGQILPLLTAGRYHEARIGEDYQVQVWDDSAGRYVSKGIFSGGARDQFSLALRLAFALATLPQELGTTPGFIFLDEPLSSFDGPRTEALVWLLTEGQVASNFSQIFVISHNRSFDVGAFPYRLALREGRVVESNLPA